MAKSIVRASSRAVWDLAARQHGVVARRQLLELGFTARWIQHRLAKGRLHRVFPGVYAVGRPQLDQRGLWMAAVLRCGPRAVLSHEAAGGLLSLLDDVTALTVSVPPDVHRRPEGIVVHRRILRAEDVTECDGIPVTAPARTLVDLAAKFTDRQVEAAVNRADAEDLVDPEALRAAIESLAGMPGVPRLRRVLDRRTFTLTDSELERYFLPIARRAGLGTPLTRQPVNGFRVDFFWPDLGLVVETDGLRYHRTPAQQARDRLRDQAHAAAGLTPLRFTHAQVRHEPDRVEAVLGRVAARLRHR
jgi:very-short-patch-repair endonuclease